ncbi:MAG: hypothetical protein HY235_14065 [Acidobacteria bacterium]|nr:hypothetical protein [Acidobacteriota bacterium]
MSRQKKILVAKIATILAALPLLIYAFELGPDPRHTGAPGDQTCAIAGCHTGTVNSGPGRVSITFPSGLTYVPGQRQRWTVTVTDALQRVFGFQATARLETNLTNGQAGAFNNVDTSTQILCDDGRVKPAAGCGQFPVEFIEHSRPATGTGTFTIEWTPPATNVGNVRIYVAGNAANGDRTNNGDRIYTANFTLTPSTGGGPPRPTITGLRDGFSGTLGVAPTTFTAVYGTDFATSTTTWDDAIQGNRLPTTLSGVTVTVDNRPAAIHFVSPAQINILGPLSIGTGPVSVVVRNANGEATFTAQASAFLPAFYGLADASGRIYVTAVALDGTFVGRPGGPDPRVTRAARPGETLLIFGHGFGPTNPVVPTDQVVTGAPAMTTPVRILFDQTVANVSSGNLVFAGLYQFNVPIPDTLANGDHKLIAEIGSATSSTNVYIPVQR